MKILQRLLIVLTLMVMATGTAWSVNNGVGNDCQGRSCESNGEGKKSMPEMDAASSTSAIALLTGIVLMMKERKRSKRPPDLDE
jgi:hypothetical protein